MAPPNLARARRTTIDGVSIRFFEVRSPEPGSGRGAAPGAVGAARLRVLREAGRPRLGAAADRRCLGRADAAPGLRGPPGRAGRRLGRRRDGDRRRAGTRPQTLGYALADSPAGQAAWIYEKFHDWTDHGGAPESVLTMNEMLDDIMLYWVTNTGASSARRYWEDARDTSDRLAVGVPAALSMFPEDIEGPSRRWAARRFQRIVRWSEAARGGHFAAYEQPAIFVDEVRAGFREIRQRQPG
jgi:hypothetical protein